jgi:hypothetical protein
MSAESEDTPPDLRFTDHARRNVKVERDLSAQGHLARGDHTNMSRLKFTARARPADPGERDPDFVAREAASQPVAPANTVPDPAPASTAAETPGLLARLGRLFGQ